VGSPESGTRVVGREMSSCYAIPASCGVCLGLCFDVWEVPAQPKRCDDMSAMAEVGLEGGGGEGTADLAHIMSLDSSA
jgi:hypothetical protein